MDSFSQLRFRCIGPFRGGRVVAVAGDPVDPMTFYFGACAGGVWKTTDGGTYWQNVSDGYLQTSAVGALAVADSDPNVVYAGMGECCIRGDVSHGDGVYRSTDGGRAWQHLGLSETRYIARVRVHPSDPDTVYVAALGDIYQDSAARGVYRSRDGGRSWQQVLFHDGATGAIDLSMDPNNPRILYAALWQTRRTPWGLVSGGPGSTLLMSTDSGDTWTDLAGRPGFPTTLKGRIGVAVSPARAGRAWAIIEAAEEKSGIYRSDDWGEHWERVSDDRDVQGRRWYYHHIFAHPTEANTVYSMSGRAYRSTDGGRTWTEMPTPHADNHDLWIDPRHPERMIQGNDGGANVSFNAGQTWSSIYNQPTAQFYHLATDNRYPYRVYGTQQDNTAVSVPSRTHKGAIPNNDVYTSGHSESGHIQVRPDNPDIVFSGAVGSSPGGGGALLRYNHRTGESKIITVWPEFYGGRHPRDLRHRFQWTYPILLSPHDPNVLYVCGERVFRSTDEGQSWTAISPDLTRNDPAKQEASGGPITLDTTGAEHYCTIFAFAESPHRKGDLWAGSDDGLLHRSSDGGTTWRLVDVPDMPEWTTISCIEPSHHDPDTVFLCGWRYRLGDYAPYLWRTRDGGVTWQRITSGLPGDDFTRIIREDPQQPGLLFAGTEQGLYVSLNGGDSWQPLQSNLPVTPVYDVQVKDGDLVVATHGRSFWVLDDLTPLRQSAESGARNAQQTDMEALLSPLESGRGKARLFPPRPTVRHRGLGIGGRAAPGVNYTGGMDGIAWFERKTRDGRTERIPLNAGTNPPEGVLIDYRLGVEPEDVVKLEVLDTDGKLIREYLSEGGPDGEPRLPAQAGFNRWVWNLRYPDMVKLPGDVPTAQSQLAPPAPPGTYQVRLTAGGETFTERFEVTRDPRVTATREDLDAQFELLCAIRDKVSDTHRAVLKLRAVRGQVESWLAAAADADAKAARPAAGALLDKLAAAEDELVQRRARGESDRLNYPGGLNAKLVHLFQVVASADGPPTEQSRDVFGHLSAQVDEHVTTINAALANEGAAFNTATAAAQLRG